ncbi:ABC transporter ATP-binding protein [Nitrospina watsonii]|uniref:Dipeptide ABC transporter ATP binding subunit DppF n=1 Tax=Nitrospina watsonii TaxID=1323948 RepID=A0ABM9HEF8_9BACT|nr:ABC transporter ATP-binding protein [Nitrospina watsonii]CAI2718636.1 dipeptide ABC transporter ATP binding subunit DppF [Nitrospina watsonii]
MSNLIELKNLKKYFPVYGGVFARVVNEVKAVDDVSLDIGKQEILGLVGESGCGKTTVGRMTLRLIEPTAGQIVFRGQDITQVSNRAMEQLRPKMQIIFQDPFSSLNPRFNVERIIGEAMLVHGIASQHNLRDKIGEVMDQVGLSPRYMRRYPHEFSGGQRQRIGIARALALDPDYIVCDEPVSALDVSIQAQIINLLRKLQQDKSLTMLFISHDLNVVKHLSQRTAVMYLGKIVEVAPTDVLNREAAHPYTQALLAAKPSLNPRDRGKMKSVGGDVPSPMNPPSGCRFHTRCPEVMEHCKHEDPKKVEIRPGHIVYCHLYT